MKKIFSTIVLLFISINNFFLFFNVLGNKEFSETHLYYLDSNNNGKIDSLEIEFNFEIFGEINFDKLFLYSNTGGLSTSKLDSVSGNTIFSGSYLSGNILGINLIEQDNFLTGLTINNSTSSHLRLKTNAGVGIKDIDGKEMRLLYGSSFNSYTNVDFKENIVLIEEEIIEEENTNSGEIIEEENTNSGEIIFPHQVKIVFQNPSYLLEKDDENISNYTCDISKTDCKINFNLNIDEGSGFVSIPTKYICEWNFGFGEETLEEEKCNPNTITYPEGEFETTFKVIEKSNTGSFFEEKIFIKNTGYIEPEPVVKTVYKTVYNTIDVIREIEPEVTQINIETPIIEIQSGLDENNICKKDDCNLNLIYNPKNSKEVCLWSFPGGSFGDGTDKKCNPGYVKYPIGNFKTTLRVYEAGNENNYKENYLYFSNSTENKDIKTDETKIIKESGNYPVAKIILQGTVGVNKKISGNYLTCQGETCSVNLDGRDSYSLDKKNLEYFWDLGNGDFFEGDNPLSYTYGLGEYKIILKVIDEDGLESTDEFFVNVIKDFDINNKVDTNIELKELNQDYKVLKISQVLPNPSGVDHAEWIEIKNTGEKEINLSGCEIDDEIKKASKPYKIEKKLFLEPGKTKRFYKFDTNITLKNTSGEQVNLLCDGFLIDNLTWTFNTPDGFIVNREIVDIKSGKVFVEKVVDGDTFVIVFPNGFKKVLRHIGIDTPETKHPQKEIEKYGIEASEFAKNILEQKEVYLILDNKNFVDKYSRLLGYLSLDNKKTFGEQILETGLAKLYDKNDFELLQKYQIIEKQAKSQRLGIWGSYEIDFTKASLEEKTFDIEKTDIDEELKQKLVEEKKVDVITDLIEESKINEQKEDLQEKIENIINKTFSQKISKQKKGIKIYGQTIPNTDIILQIKQLENEELSFLNFFISKTFAEELLYFQTTSDKNGKYEVLIDEPILGEFEVSSVLKANSGEVFEVFKRNTFEVDEDYIEYVESGKKTIVLEDSQEKNIISLKAIINLQGRIAAIHSVFSNKIICKEVDECSVNLDGRDSKGPKGSEYFWDFGNGQTFVGVNPTSHKFKKGNYIVSLTVSSGEKKDQAYFVVEVLGKTPKEEKINPIASIENQNSNQLNIFIPNANAGFEEIKKLTFRDHIIYSSLLFLLFLILSFIILRRRKIL